MPWLKEEKVVNKKKTELCVSYIRLFVYKFKNSLRTLREHAENRIHPSSMEITKTPFSKFTDKQSPQNKSNDYTDTILQSRM